ncbi:MAG TPA: nucleoside deaminase [Verrucomicrobiae bacterium]|nr:nucleoside deaminase [Verrucomicrobiae bacterium]
MKKQAGCASGKGSILTTRRLIVAGAACAAVLPAASTAQAAASGPASAEDEQFMRMALDEARRGDFPFGTVIVRDNQVIARGRNQGITKDDPTAHGEMEAIRSCLAEHGSKALVGSTLYTSGEPCVMCMGAILWCHIGRLVFGATVEQLSTKIEQIMISSADLAARESFAPISITGVVLAPEEMRLFK